MRRKCLVSTLKGADIQFGIGCWFALGFVQNFLATDLHTPTSSEPLPLRLILRKVRLMNMNVCF